MTALGATRSVPCATRKARFGVMNGRSLCELTGAGSGRSSVIKVIPEPAPISRSGAGSAKTEGAAEKTDASYDAPIVSRLLRSRSQLR
jgi:hypothetical protein